MRVVAVGDNCIDYYPKLQRWYPTGNCVDSIVNIADSGIPSAIVSATGTDAYGDSVERLLRDKGVDVSHLHRCEGKTAMATMDLVGESGKDRLHVSFDEGVLPQFDLTGEDLEFIRGFDIVHSMVEGFVNRHIPTIKAMGKTIVFDFSTFWNHRDAEMLTPHIDYGFFSYDGEGEDETVREFLRQKHAKGMRVPVVTMGDKGSIAYDGKEFFRQGCCPIGELCNTVGAGDSYIAGFTVGLARGLDLAACMQNGAALAARIVQVFEPYENYDFAKITASV